MKKPGINRTNLKFSRLASPLKFRKNTYNKTMNQRNVNDVKRPELLEMCKKKGFKNYRHLKKSELAKLLEKI